MIRFRIYFHSLTFKDEEESESIKKNGQSVNLCRVPASNMKKVEYGG